MLKSHSKPIHTPRGSAMVLGFALVLVLVAMALAFASRLTANQMRVESDLAGDRSYELAQTVNTLKIQQVWADFKGQSATQRVAWLGGEDANGNGILDKGEDANKNNRLDPAHAPDYQDSAWVKNDVGYVCTRIKVLSMLKDRWALVRFTTWARVQDDLKNYDVLRKVQRVARFSLKPASVFDFVYFATNYGTIDGKQVTMYGPLGANGNLTFANNPKVNGKIFAAANPETGALGTISGRASHDSISSYGSLLKANPLLRPTNPAAIPEDLNHNGYLDPGEDLNKNGVLDSFRYDLGYDGTQTLTPNQTPAVMPLLGDLEVFKGYATTHVRAAHPEVGEPGGGTGGLLKQLSAPGLDPANPANYTILINQIYGDSGEVGMKAVVNATTGAITYTPMKAKIETNPTQGWKNGNIAVIGTPAQPLVIDGPVVITNDLVIKGPITGQGTFFVGRNTHVVGDITYVNPPNWTPNDINFDKTAAANRKKDAVGFGTRGNIILGNYVNMDTSVDMWNTTRTYITPPYTHQEAVRNREDDQIGYGDGKGYIDPLLNALVYGTFGSNYTIIDGDKFYLDNETSPALPNRAYYQSTFPKAYINSIAAKPKNMHGFYYSGHLIAGRADTLTLFGSLIASDEGILSDRSATFIYDPRISQIEPSSYVNLFLPSDAALNIVYWKDNGADDATPASSDW